MKLKRVRLFGFKTFADRAEFSVHGGIVAVVGPNGCGKSNLVDAILWALGGATPRQLRAETNQDVIFNGSARRKAVGFAEVVVTFDNEDGSLPHPASEVSVSRRISRGGDTEYRLNGRPCRGRDVHDLLADSGLGRAGYAVVGQRDIDQALAASPLERRAWLDEAAGVQRYRARRVECTRRLAAARDHLARSGDLLGELMLQHGPLREEKERAERYLGTQAALREVEVGLLAHELATARRDADAAREGLRAAREAVAALSARADEAERRGKLHAGAVSKAEIEADALRERRGKALAELSAQETAVQLADERLRAAGERQQGFDEDAAPFAARLASAEEEAAHARAALADAPPAPAAPALGGEEPARRALQEAERALADARKENARRAKARAEAEVWTRRQADLGGEETRLAQEEADLAEAIEALRPELATLREGSEAARSRLEAALRERDAARTQAEEAQSAVRRLRAEIATLEGRQRGLEFTLESHEGLAAGARAVLEAVGRGRLRDAYLPVADALASDERTAVAIETALGASANDLIVPNEGLAKEAIALLKAERAGRATFQPLSLVRPADLGPGGRALLRRPGVLGRASDLVQARPEHRPVAESLLGRVLVVETLDHALALAREGGFSRLVTLDGEVVHGSGAVTGGRAARAGVGPVQRRAELARVEEELAALRPELAAREGGPAAPLDSVEEAEGAVRAARQAEEERAARARGLEWELKEVRELRRRRGEERTGLRPAEPVGEDLDLAPLEAERDRQADRLAQVCAEVERERERQDWAARRRREAADALAGAERRLTLLQDEAAARRRKREEIGPLRERLAQERARAEEAATRGRAERDRLSHALAEVEARRKEALETSFRAAEEGKALRAEAAALAERAPGLEVARARAESRSAQARERLLEEYGLTPDDLPPDGPAPAPDAAALVGRLRRELKAMGPVHLGAIESFARLDERVVELRAQMEDVEGGIAEVEATARELDELTRDRFTATFEAVRAAFADLFGRLIGGGEGDMRLTDPASILESGIEIEVAMPGKRRQPLSLLSGGERSLCAATFLFALLRVRPSPLVVLDEVDAPLDGRNVERFVAMLQEFAREIQFVVITHHPATIAAAPVWLGVTMQDPGVSSLVPLGGTP